MPEKPKVLIADDELAICRSCKKTLTLEGCDVDIVHHGLEAMTALEKNSYDLLVTDLRMPKMDGMQLLSAIKEKGLNVKVVMITGYGTVRTAVEAIKRGAFDYLSKPFAADELAAVALRALGRKQERDVKENPSDQPVREFSSLFGDIDKSELDRMWSIPEHSWVRAPHTGPATVGIDVMYLRLVGEGIRSVEPVATDTELRQGEACAKIIATRKGDPNGETVTHNLWSPITGKVIEVNNAIVERPETLSDGPYGNGWILKLETTTLEKDIPNLRPFLETVGALDLEK